MAGPPPLDLAAIRAYCDQRVSPEHHDKLRIKAIVEGNAVTIVERRPPWKPEWGPNWTTGLVARLRYIHKTQTWALFWRDRNQKWHRYELAAPSARVTTLLNEIEHDPTGIFWG